MLYGFQSPSPLAGEGRGEGGGRRMSKGKLRVERDGPVGRLVLDNPERRNAIGAQMWLGIPRAIDDFNNDAAVRVIVIRGEGTQAFAAGADISEFEKNRSSGDQVKAYEEATSAA